MSYQNKNADMSVGAADTSVRATSGATVHWRKWPKPRGGLKGRLQARLPATPGGRPHVTNGQSRVASSARLRSLNACATLPGKLQILAVGAGGFARRKSKSQARVSALQTRVGDVPAE